MEWRDESWTKSKDVVYKDIEEDAKVSDEYLDAAVGVCAAQIALGGFRLQGVLEKVYEYLHDGGFPGQERQGQQVQEAGALAGTTGASGTGTKDGAWFFGGLERWLDKDGSGRADELGERWLDKDGSGRADELGQIYV